MTLSYERKSHVKVDQSIFYYLTFLLISGKGFMKTIILVLILVSFNSAHAQTDSSLHGYVDSITFKEAEVHPAFVGGDKAWVAFLKKEIQYRGTRGTVILEFTVRRNNDTPKDVVIYRSDNPALNNEAIRVIKKSRWVPAVADGRTVSYRMRQEIEFK